MLETEEDMGKVFALLQRRSLDPKCRVEQPGNNSIFAASSHFSSNAFLNHGGQVGWIQAQAGGPVAELAGGVYGFDPLVEEAAFGLFFRGVLALGFQDQVGVGREANQEIGVDLPRFDG